VSQFIADFRKKNPQYNDMADDQLVSALHRKYYSDMDVEAFNQKIGYQSVAEQPIEQVQAVEPQVEPTQAKAIQSEVIPQQEVIEQQEQEPSMFDMVSSKLNELAADPVPNAVKGAIERAGDVGAGFLTTINTAAREAEQSMPIGGFVWDGGVLPSYKGPEEYQAYLQQGGKDILAETEESAKGLEAGYIPTHTWEEVKREFSEGGALSGSAWGEVVGYIGEQGVKSIPDMAAALLNLPSYIIARSGEIGETRAENKGKDKTDLIDIVEAVPFAVGSALLERIGAKGITEAGAEAFGKEALKSGFKEAAKRTAKAGAKAGTKEAVTEAIQEGMIEYAGERLGTNAKMTLAESLDLAAAGAVAGGGMGGGAGTVSAGYKEATYNPEAELGKALNNLIDQSRFEIDQEAITRQFDPANAQLEARPQQESTEGTIKLKPHTPLELTGEFEGVQPKGEFAPGMPESTPAVYDIPEAPKNTKQIAEEKAEPKEQGQIKGLAVVEAPIDEVTLSSDVPQFKEGANASGVVEPLGGKFERTGVAPIQIWVREDGRKEVISGRHSLDLAKRSGEQTIPAQYHYESEGFTVEQAASLDAILNIREGQGKVKDYVEFIQATKPTEAEAAAQGILARQTGKRAFTIADSGSDTLIASHRANQISDEAATRIARAAPKNDALQSVGIKAIQDGKTIIMAENLVKAVGSMTTDKQQATDDLFGFDDSAMKEAVELAKKVGKKQAEIQRTLTAVTGAAKNPELARKEGVDVKDPEGIKKKIKQLKSKKKAWDNWHTNPKLMEQLTGKKKADQLPAKEEVTKKEEKSYDVDKWNYKQGKADSTQPVRTKTVKGITLNVSESFEDKQMFALNSDGEVVGDLFFSFDEGKLYGSVEVREDSRRQGIATMMYDFASEIEGVEINPSEGHTDDAAAFWADRKAKKKPELSQSDADRLIADVKSSDLGVSRTNALIKDITDAVNGKQESVKRQLKNLAELNDKQSKSETKAKTEETKAKTKKTQQESKAALEKEQKRERIYSGNYEGLQPNYVTWLKSLSDTKRKELFAKGSNPTIANSEFIAYKPDFDLGQQTEADIKAAEEKQAKAKAEEKAAEAKAEADKQVDDFVLAGSDRVADQAEARGQAGLFDAPAEPKAQQTDSTIEIKRDGKTVASVDYSVFEGIPAVKMINTDPDYQRQGLATEALIKLQAKFPDVEIDLGSLTGDGAKLIDSLEYNVIGSGDYESTVNKLEETEAKLEEYSELAENFNFSEATEAERLEYREATKDWDDLHDLKNDLENELAELEPSKKIIIGKKKKAEPKAKKEPVASSKKEPATKDPIKLDYSNNAVIAFHKFRESTGKGTATKQDIQSSFDDLVESKDAVLAQLKKLTKAQLLKYVGRSDLKKPAMVEAAYKTMLSAHVFGDMVMTIFGGSKTYEEQIAEKVAKQTQEQIETDYERQREARAERDKRKESFVKSLTNPETLAEYKEFIRVRGKAKLTTEQLKTYDTLVADSMLEEDKAKPKTVQGEAEAVETTRAETTHAKKGHQLFVVSLVNRVSKEQYKELNDKAKEFGGYYSAYNKAGAIPGFQFKTIEEADQFEQVLKGKDTDKSDFEEAKADVKNSKQADKLMEMADKLEAKGNESLGQDRQTNTGKRAAQAASASEKAYKQIATAQTVKQIATKMAAGEIVYLGKMTQITQLEELKAIQRKAVPSSMMHSEYDGYSISNSMKEGVTVEDYINNVRMPELFIDKERAKRFSDKLDGVKGFSRFSAELKKLPMAEGKVHLGRLTKDQVKKIHDAVKAGHLSSYELGFIPDREKTMNRLDKLGIKTDEQLRTAIRELDSLTVTEQKEDPIKKLERDLVGKKIEGYFPTPRELVEQMIDYAEIQPGHQVLEPSAGKGNIADIIKESEPNAEIDVIEINQGLRSMLEIKGYNVVSNDFTEYDGKQYDRIIMNPPFENFQDIDHVKHAYELLKPGGKLVAIMGAGVKNSRKKAVEFRQWIDESGSYIEDLPDGSFKSSERQTGVATVMVTIDKPDTNTLNRREDEQPAKLNSGQPSVVHAPGHNYVDLYRSTGIPSRKEVFTIEGRSIKMPAEPQRIEPIMRQLVKIMGRRIYNGKIKGKSVQGFYRSDVGELRTARKNDVEILAHEMAHYLDLYSNVSLPNFKRLYKQAAFKDEVAALSYTDDKKLELLEGFAEFVRLWLTNSNEAKLRAPGFYDAFVKELARDRKLLNPMRDMQEAMHKFYFQGSDKLGQALIGRDEGVYGKFMDWTYRRDSLVRQETIDKFHAAREVEKELTGKLSDPVQGSAWKQFRIANGGYEGIAEYIMNYGTLEFAENGDLVRSGKSLYEILKPVDELKGLIKADPKYKGQKPIDLLMRYFAGRRALELHRQGRENLIPKETAKEWAKMGRTFPMFGNIFIEYQEFNTRMMDMYQQAGLLTPEARQTMESVNKDYVPFNRLRDSLEEGKGGGGGFQRLKGGTANLEDILHNIQDGVTSNVKAALDAKAKQRLYQYIANHRDGAIWATKIAPDSKLVKTHLADMEKKIGEVLEASGVVIEGELDLSDPGLLNFWQHGVKPTLTESGNFVDTVLINGKPQYFEVQDPLLQEMLLTMNGESYSSLMNGMFAVKNFFTRSITLGVEFTGANLVRDTIGATFISKNKFMPFVGSFKGMYSYLSRDEHFQDFMRSGGGYSSRLHGSTKAGKARQRVQIKDVGVGNRTQRMLSAFDNIMSAFEYGTRIGEFRLAKKNGASDMDAAFAAREISTDFSVYGANHFLTGYIRTVPFLNAMIQSQDRVFREAFIKNKYGGNPTGLAMKAFLGLTVPTLLLWLFNKDDEEYKEIPDHEKRTNWHIPLGNGRFMKMPRPYDVGFVYATMPELFFKYLEDENGKEYAEGMAWTMLQMYGIDGVPAAAQGWWDITRNKKWTGAPVVPHGMADVSATNQYNSNTSETFIRLGQALGMSPIKAEHAFKAQTGYLGGYLLWGTEKLMWDEDKFGEMPDKDVSSNIFIKRFLTPETRPNNRSMEKFFDLKEQSDRVTADFKAGIDIRRMIKGDKQTEFEKDDTFFGLSKGEKEVLFALNDSMNDLISIAYGKEGIKTQEHSIRYNPKLTAEQKRESLDKLWQQRNAMFTQYYNEATKALDKAKKVAKKTGIEGSRNELMKNKEGK
jgi:GNAT superfamily N-acetyltransferase/phospholipid N-methyltransferase